VLIGDSVLARHLDQAATLSLIRSLYRVRFLFLDLTPDAG